MVEDALAEREAGATDVHQALKLLIILYILPLVYRVLLVICLLI